MTSHALADSVFVGEERPSVDEWIVEVLRQRGAQTLDRLGDSLPNVNWARLFLAIDRLNRAGKVAIWPPQNGDYLVSLSPNPSGCPVCR